MKFEPTDVERLILANQYDILAKLDPEEAEGHRRLAHNLRHGHAPLYTPEKTDLRPRMSDHDTKLVMDALVLHSSLEISVADIDGLDVEDVKWRGFDGNNETELLGFTAALLEAGQFVFLMPNGAVNSHSETRETYLRMVIAWEGMGKPHKMSAAQVAAIIAARRHPDA